jgi:hypothetical protein
VLSEALTARVINAVASNPDIWKQSVIIPRYDESDGFYDHVPPRILSYGEKNGIPIVLLHHLTAVLDDWDPRTIDSLAQKHRISRRLQGHYARHHR